MLNEPDDRFCGSCGSPLGATEGVGGTADATAGEPTAAAAPVAERRLVSVLFADLVGFTGLSDQRDPEQVRDLLGRYFETSRERIERYGGTVEKFIGDAVMAVWGTPVAHEDDAERAVRAALELIDAVAALGPEVDDGAPPLRVRAAVVTGEAAVTLGAVGQGMVAGDLVNTASRLQGAAAPGQVLVGEGTERAASSAIVFEPVPDQALRGKALPVPAWQAVRVVAGRRGVGRSAQMEPPFVGRDDEFRLLKDLLHATAREHRARLISVTGVAGIGKSRLAWELEKYIDGVVETIYWHQGRSPAYGEGVTFWALGEMVRQRARIAESDGPDESRGKLRATLEDYVDDGEERAWMEGRLAALLGLEPTPPGERDELFAAWRRLFERISERGPVALVFEELQWADEGLLDFIEALLEWSRTRPIYVLTLARPELLDRRPSWGAGQRSFTSIHLEPLDAEAMELLLVGLVPGIPPGLIRLVAERAEGVPLFAVELVRMLLDQGRIVQRDGRYHLAGEVTADDLATLPDSLHALIGARLDGLDASERSLLQRAAVLGQSFTVDALAHLADRPPERVDAALRALTRKELLTLDSDPRSPERGQYLFVQSLIREVAYGRLSRRDRAAQHQLAAHYFENLGDPELAGVVASHYMQAHQAAGGTGEAGQLAEHAVRALGAAADRAVALHNHRQAFAFLNDAISFLGDDARRLEHMERAADAAFAGDMRADALRLYKDLVEWHRLNGNRADQTRAMRRYGTLEIWSAEGPTAAVRYLEAARDELASSVDERDLATLEADLARACLMAGDFHRADETIDRALPVAERLELLPTIAELLASKGWAAAELGRAREGIALIRGALPFAERVGFPNAYFRAAMNLSAIGSLDDPREGSETALRALEKAERFGYHDWATYLSANATYDQFLTGDWDAAISVHDSHAREDLHPDARLNFDAAVIMITAYRGDADTAERWLASLSEMAHAPSPQDRSLFHDTAGHVAFATGRFEDAYREARAEAEIALSQSPLRGHLLAARAALWLRDTARLTEALDELASIPFRATISSATEMALNAGRDALADRTAESRAQYQEAIAGLDEIGGRLDAALARLERSVFLETDDAEGAAHRADALEALENLGASTLSSWMDATPETGTPKDLPADFASRVRP
ncbi:MAG: AAA family ATPase [Chloroflexota bacterium]|nr:AAA family ATPase [Chloroflexota bacterium]